MSNGESVASTMGFTAVDGLPMGTRCGALDPGVILYLMDERGMDARAIEKLIYNQSGLLGVSGISSDMRTLLACDDPRAKAAVDLFVYRIGRELGSLAAALGGLDAIVFTGGIGEHASRSASASAARRPGSASSSTTVANASGGPRISADDEPAGAWVIPTNEELMIARHTRRCSGLTRLEERHMLQGKSAIVTGSTSGIGLGIARALAAEGANVMLNGFGDAGQIEKLRAALAKRIRRKGRVQRRRPVEARRRSEPWSARRHGARLGGHARQQRRHPAHGGGRGIRRRALGCGHRDQSVVELSCDQGRAADHEGPQLGPHRQHRLDPRPRRFDCRSPRTWQPSTACSGLTKVVALETAKTGITCNAICPGWVLTPLVQKQIDDRAARERIPVESAKIDLLGEKQPSHEFATPEQIGALAVFLCSDAAAQIRGAALPVDGGWTAQ